MKPAERQTRTRLMELFARHGFHPNTRLGQNFLIDLNVIEFVVRQADVHRDDLVLEIGAGTGGMTTFLATQAGHVVAVEIDANMHRLASEVVADRPNVTLLHADELRNKNHFAPEVLAEVQKHLDDGLQRLKLVANLPYSVATPVVSNLVASELPWERMVVTIQLELADRMVAAPRTADYGALSAWLQSQCRVELLRKLPPTVFWPRPKVTSAVVGVQPDIVARERIRDREFFQDFLRRVFGLRRKLLRGVLAGMYRDQLSKTDVDRILAEAGVPDESRAEQLEPAVLVDLSNRLRGAVAT
jgi:16S rRNA (adenine1518-N6/adenine1519-N6)-dimethyltransferase